MKQSSLRRPLRPYREIFVANEKTSPAPNDIRLNAIGIVESTFGKCEVEETAGHLIAFFQAKGAWGSFKLDELAEFYRSKGWDPNNMFFGLVGAWFDDGGLSMCWVECPKPYIAFDGVGSCYVTEEFVKQCCHNLKKKRVA